MDQDEIDLWYEDEKERVMEEYLKELENNKNKETAEKEFNAKMDSIMKKYNKLMAECIDNKGKTNKFKDFIQNFVSRLNFRK